MHKQSITESAFILKRLHININIPNQIFFLVRVGRPEQEKTQKLIRILQLFIMCKFKPTFCTITLILICKCKSTHTLEERRTSHIHLRHRSSCLQDQGCLNKIQMSVPQFSLHSCTRCRKDDEVDDKYCDKSALHIYRIQHMNLLCYSSPGNLDI